VRFLSGVIDDGIGKYLETGHVLDFGSGPTPVLAELLRRRGYEVSLYDLFYHDDPSVFDGTYDGIVSTEVVEHLADPIGTLRRLSGCLESGGYLSLMTLFAPEDKAVFLDWHYRRDPTHIAFFHLKTLARFEALFNLRLIDHDGKRVATFRKL
jgi:2-polyprenyl-3-methyl-5-hydroxy-6-metoxy-1,4-benzoquinol methylase